MARRALFALGLLLTLVTCRDGSGPQLYYARVAVAPIFPSDAGLAAFGLSIDGVRLVVVRRGAAPPPPPPSTGQPGARRPARRPPPPLPLASSPPNTTGLLFALAGGP